MLKKICLSFLIFTSLNIGAQVGIGTTNPDPSAVLDMTSTSQGVLTPRMMTAQRLAVVSPATGLLVFDTDDANFFIFIMAPVGFH